MPWRADVGHYIFNVVEREDALRSLRARRWEIGSDERHAESLAPGDLALGYVAAPARVFVGRAEIASTLRDWPPPAAVRSGVLLRAVEEWDPPVPMATVLANIGPSETAKADFDAGIVRISASEYEAALAAAAESAPVE